MRSILIGAVNSTRIMLQAMHEAGCVPSLLATLDPAFGRARHADYVDLAPLARPQTEVAFVSDINTPEFLAKVEAVDPEVIFVVGWSQMVGERLHAVARRYCVGFHPTLLPQLRGRAALGWTILLGLDRTGSTLFVIDSGADTGPIIDQIEFKLGPRETISTLIAKHDVGLRDMLSRSLSGIIDGSLRPKSQPDVGVSYGAKRTAQDNLVDWSASAAEIDRLIRASARPYSGAFTYTSKRRVTIWEAEPIALPHPYHAEVGQIATYRNECPVVRCGDGEFLLIRAYDAGLLDEASRPLSGQIRFRGSPPLREEK